MTTILVTGASGFLGWHFCQIAAQYGDIYGTYLTHPVTLAQGTTIKVDLTDFNTLKQLFQDLKPAVVIHTAAAAKPNYCQTHPTESYSINVIASSHLAALCAQVQIPCIFTSTDLVFDGKNAPYRETDPVSPVSLYGEQKVQAEQAMLAEYPQTAICRMPLMFGLPAPASASFIQPFIETLREGKKLQLFTDEYRSPISAKTATEGLLLALNRRVAGILHLGGKERISRYDFGCLMAEVLGLPKEAIEPCLQKDFPMAAPRPADVSLDSSQAFNLGYNPPSLREELEKLAIFSVDNSSNP